MPDEELIWPSLNEVWSLSFIKPVLPAGGGKGHAGFVLVPLAEMPAAL